MSSTIPEPDLSSGATVSQLQKLNLDVNSLPTSSDIASMRKLIDVSPPEAVKVMHRSTFYPFYKIVSSSDKRNKFKLIGSLLETLDMILKKIPVDFHMYFTYQMNFVDLLYDKSQTDLVANIPEELLLTLLRAQTTLMLNATDETRKTLYQESHYILLVQMVYLVSQVAKREKLRSLRVQAITCIMAMTGIHDQYVDENGEMKDKELERLISKCVSEILPGILSSLHDVALCKMNPGFAVIVKALCAMRRILRLVMNNKYYALPKELTLNEVLKMVEEQSALVVKKNDEGSEARKAGSPAVKPAVRSKQWWQIADSKVFIVARAVLNSHLLVHESWQVRRELCLVAADILHHCSNTMGLSMAVALNTLLKLSGDEYNEVAETCRLALWQHYDRKSVEDSRNVTDALIDLFHENLLSLPRVVHNVDMAMKVLALRSLTALIELIKQRKMLDELLTSVGTRNSLFVALIEAARFNVSGVTLLMPIECRNLEDLPAGRLPYIDFRHFDSKHEGEFRKVCHALGDTECVELLVDSLMEWVRDRPDDSREATYLLTYVASGPSKVDKKSTMKRVVEFYLDHERWYLPLKIGSNEPPLTDEDTLDVSVYDPRSWIRDDVKGLYAGATETRYTDISYQHSRQPRARRPGCCLSVLEAKGNMLLACLTTAGLGLLAQQLREDFQPYELRSICMVLERAGSEYAILATAGRLCLKGIAEANGFNDVSKFICANADYITFKITVRLFKPWQCESALKILSVVIAYSDQHAFSSLQAIVQHMLESSTQEYFKSFRISYLQVLWKFTSCILKWFSNESGKNTKPTSEYNICNEVIDYLTANTSSNDNDSPLDDEYDNASCSTVETKYFEDLKKKEESVLDHGEKVTEEKPPPPAHIATTVSVMKRCINFLPSKVLEEKLLTMEILSTGLVILEQHEDELLPVVHLIWAPLVERFREPFQPTVMRMSFELLVVMVSASKEFIRSRVIKEVLPILCEFLKKSALDSNLKDQGSHYRQTAAYRLQETVLTKMHALAENLKLDDEHLESVFRSMDAYLSNRQPKPLQDLAVQFFERMLQYDRGAVWYHLRKLCKNQYNLEPPPSNLGLIPIVGTPYASTDKNFDANIKRVFHITCKDDSKAEVGTD